MAHAPELPWDLDLDLDLGFDFDEASLAQPLHSLQGDYNLLEDPLKDFESIGSSDPALKPSATVPPAALSHLFQDMPGSQDHCPALEGECGPPGSGSGSSVDMGLPAPEIKKPKRSRKPQKVSC